MDANFLEKLPMYKTAYSPLYDAYVGIKEVVNGAGGILLRCNVVGMDNEILFNVEELEDYCL
jgi:hypothetical protein